MSTTIQPLTADHAPARSLGRRLSTIVLLQLTNPMTLIGWPLIILTIIFLANVGFVAVLTSATEGRAEVLVNGGVGFIWVYTLVMAVQSVNQTFPLALGFGATRRDYLIGTGILFAGLSVGYALLISTLAMVERAVDYWGIKLGFFDSFPGWPWHEILLAHVLTLLLAASIGAATAAVYVRWRATGMYVFWAGLVALLIGTGLLIGTLNAWEAVGQFFATAGVLGTLLWSLVITGLSALAAYAILRRATPTNT